MAEDYVKLYVGGGFTLRLAIKNCEGEWIEASDVQSITYTVYKKEYDSRSAVTGHSAVTIPTSAFLSSTATDPHTSESYNFSYQITNAVNNPFPDFSSIYVIHVVFTDTSGASHVHEIDGVTA